MQDNSDTTIVVENASNWVTDAPEIYLLSKKGDTLTCYTYRDLVYQRSGILIPKRIRGEMRKANRLKILVTEIDVNEFLYVSAIDQKTLGELWNKIKREKPWTLLDDQAEGQGCGMTSKSNAYISDDGGLNLYLITKSEIKKLEFYAPWFYQKQCRSRQGRKSVLRIGALFHKYVQ